VKLKQNQEITHQKELLLMMSQLKTLNEKQNEVLEAFECIDAVDTAR